jgi:hypothetical protein
MTTPKNTLNSQNHYAQSEQLPVPNEIDIAAHNFVKLYDARASFFTDIFVRKVKEGNRKALAELQRYPLPPTQMDLRQEFAKCIKADISDDYTFRMKDGKVYTTRELKRLVHEWFSAAEKALIESDPALADKLMSPAQWNAKSAFEVTYVTAMNELRDIKKTRQAGASLEHYIKWVVNPLEKAMEQVNAVNPPGNSLVGFGNRIPLADAMITARGFREEFQKLLQGKTG